MNGSQWRSLPAKQIAAIAVRILGAAFGFLATLVVTRQLGADQAGIFFASVAWASFLAIFARWGMQDVLLLSIPDLAEEIERSQLIARVAGYFRVLIVRLAVLVPLTIVAWFALYAAGLGGLISIAAIAVLLVVTACLQMASALAKARHIPAMAFFGELVVPPILVLAALLGLAAEQGVLGISGATTAYAMAGLGGLLVLGLAVRKDFGKPTRIDPVPPGDLKRANTFAVTELALFVSAFGSVLLMPFLLGAEETGAFNLSLRIVAVGSLVPTSIAAVITPAMVKAWKANDKVAIHRTLRHARFMMALAAVIYAVGIWAVGPVVLAWAGTQFTVMNAPMMVMMIGYFGGLLCGPSGVLLAVSGREAVARNIAIASAILSLLALVMATILFGYLGTAVVVGSTFFLHRLALLVAERLSRNTA